MNYTTFFKNIYNVAVRDFQLFLQIYLKYINVIG